MATSAINAATAGTPANFKIPVINGRPDLEFAKALDKVSPQAQVKAKATATDFEAMFLNSMFSQMMTGIDGDGPFGGKGALKVWRSFMTDQYAKSFAKAGGIGIAAKVYATLLKQQGLSAS